MNKKRLDVRRIHLGITPKADAKQKIEAALTDEIEMKLDEATITCSYPVDYVYDIWKDNFDELANEGDKIFVLKLHPQLIGRSSRVRMLERFIAYMKANGAWLASCEDVARYVKEFYAKRAEGGEA